MMLKGDYYTYRVSWSEEDQEYIGTCLEFPSLSWLADDYDQALHGIRQVVSDVIADMKTNLEEIPESLSKKKYSGRFLVRVTPDLHRQLVFEAAEAGVSLNRLASDKLSRVMVEKS